tara:strand:- start:6539 stop:7654 length:1116 start_codon:yes stop_codon:yes gene_type:complete
MAYLKTSDSIIIKAVLTDEGRKLISRGEFKIAKFTLGDDEIDYELFNPSETYTEANNPAINSIKILEAYGDKRKNLHFGLNSFDSGILYIDSDKEDPYEAAAAETYTTQHAHIMHLPILKSNDKLGVAASVSGTMNYLAVNDETADLLNTIPNFKFLQNKNFDNCKLVVESGMSNISAEHYDGVSAYVEPTPFSREELILKKFLLDSDYFVYVDDRFIRNVVGINQESTFKNFQSGETIIKFLSNEKQSYPISLESEFDGYATYIFRGIPNLMYDWATSPEGVGKSTTHSVHEGPRGTVFAFNPIALDELKINSGDRTDFRYTKFGQTDKIVFSELPTSKFDYIDTTIYIVGSTTNSGVSMPLRIIRYAGK